MIRALFPLLLLASIASAAQLAINSARFTITSSDGSQLRSEKYVTTRQTSISSFPSQFTFLHLSFDLSSPPKSALTLGATDTLKLTFTITENGKEGKGVQPHQTFLRFYDEETGEEGIEPVRVSSLGKAKFQLVRFLRNFCNPNLTFNSYTCRTWLAHYYPSLQRQKNLFKSH